MKSICLHADGTAGFEQRLRISRRLAQTFDASVTTVYCVNPTILRYPIASTSYGMMVAGLTELDEADKRKVRELFIAATAGDRRFRWEEAIGDSVWSFQRQVLYSDLLVLGQRNSEEPAADQLPPEFLSSTLVGSGVPALIIPYAGQFDTIGSNVLIAWKESRESARAVTASIPWLKLASTVHIVSYSANADNELASLQARLAAHGIACKVHTGGPERAEAGNALLSLAADVSADLLVMGCYGHSRSREWVMGGATRTILRTMTLPVLMIH